MPELRGGDKAAWFNPRFSPDGRKVYAITDKGDKSRVWRCDIATGVSAFVPFAAVDRLRTLEARSQEPHPPHPHRHPHALKNTHGPPALSYGRTCFSTALHAA